MQSSATTVADYLKEVPTERIAAMLEMRATILKNIPQGFAEEMSYGMVGYVVPHSIYPDGYKCNKQLPLPFVSFASQKNTINFYHMGLYANPTLLKWFMDIYPKHSSAKLDMGKSCIRFKKMDQIPFNLIGELMRKMTVQDWITCYEKNFIR